MGKTNLKANTKNSWFYIAGALATVQAARYLGIFIECLSSNIGVIITTALEAVIFILFAVSCFFFASANFKKTAIPSIIVCLYMSATAYGLFDTIKNALGGSFETLLNTSLLNILRMILAIMFVILAVVYTLKCFGKFQTRKPLLTCATITLMASYALLVSSRLSGGATVINALFTLDLADPSIGIPLCFTALTLSLKS